MICDIKLLIYENIKYGITHRERLKTKRTNNSSISESSSKSNLYQSENDFEYKLGRMSVLEEFRGKGLGTKILKQFEIIAKEKNISEIYLEAQSDKLDFYLKENYVIKGTEYIMDGISHKLMFKIIS